MASMSLLVSPKTTAGAEERQKSFHEKRADGYSERGPQEDLFFCVKFVFTRPGCERESKACLLNQRKLFSEDSAACLQPVDVHPA